MPNSNILAYTTTFSSRDFGPEAVEALRASAGIWFDWAVFAGAPDPALEARCRDLLNTPSRTGIQYLTVWPENRGQHWGTVGALKIARDEGYKWLLRLDDDVRPKTKRWLKKMTERLQELKNLTQDEAYRLVAAPKLIGLKNPLKPVGVVQKGQAFPCEVMDILGGGCRLHPVELLDGYTPNLYDPMGRGDPVGIKKHVEDRNGLLVRFPDIRIYHDTKTIEAGDSPESARTRQMGYVWPWLETDLV